MWIYPEVTQLKHAYLEMEKIEKTKIGTMIWCASVNYPWRVKSGSDKSTHWHILPWLKKWNSVKEGKWMLIYSSILSGKVAGWMQDLWCCGGIRFCSGRSMGLGRMSTMSHLGIVCNSLPLLDLSSHNAHNVVLDGHGQIDTRSWVDWKCHQQVLWLDLFHNGKLVSIF